jgi:hypothetical protein
MDMSTKMGNLIPGTDYVYESPDGGQTVYARKIGSSERILVGESYAAKAAREMRREDQLWHNIRVAALTNPTLQDALERAIMIYQLSNEHDEIDWHPI